jgi:predicted transcriptional regulator
MLLWKCPKRHREKEVINLDKKKLEDAMDKKKIRKSQMCELLGISRSAFFRKCNGTSEFTLSEIQQMVEILGLESPIGIFFAEKVS